MHGAILEVTCARYYSPLTVSLLFGSWPWFFSWAMKAALVLTHIWITCYQTASNLKYKSYIQTVKCWIGKTNPGEYTDGFNCSDKQTDNVVGGQYAVLDYFSWVMLFLGVFFLIRPYFRPWLIAQTRLKLFCVPTITHALNSLSLFNVQFLLIWAISFRQGISHLGIFLYSVISKAYCWLLFGFFADVPLLQVTWYW